MRLPVRPIADRWPGWLERTFARFFWADPLVVLDDGADPADFRTAMSAFHVGGTIKITGGDRHAIADSLLVDHLDLTNASIVDIGASDGSTSVDLIAKLPEFKSYVIADLYLAVSYVQRGERVFFFDQDGMCILVVGRRVIAWPSISSLVALGYRRLIRRSHEKHDRMGEVLLLNPEARALIAADSRVSFAVHDVFTAWSGELPDVIKVANLLRRLYFDDTTISRALASIHQSLVEGGHFLVVDNPRIPGMGPRAGLFRREVKSFSVVATTADEPEIIDLVHAFSIS